MSKSDSNKPSPIPSSSNADHRRSDHVPISSSQTPTPALFRATFSDDEDGGIDLNQRPVLFAQTDMMTATESTNAGNETRNDLTTPLVPEASDLNEPGILNARNLHQLGK